MKRWLAQILSLAIVAAAPGPQAWASMRASVRTAPGANISAVGNLSNFKQYSATLPSLTVPSLDASLPVLPQSALPLIESAQRVQRVNAADPVPSAAREAPRPARTAPKKESTGRPETPRTVLGRAQALEQNIAEIGDGAEKGAEANPFGTRDVLDAVFDGSAKATGAEAVAASVSRKPSRFGRLAAAAVGAGVLTTIVAAPAGIAAPLAKPEAFSASAKIIEALSISPEFALAAAVAVPFAVFVVPTLISSFVNRRSAQTARLAKAVVNHADREWDTEVYRFFEKTVTRRRGNTTFLDRVVVKQPRGSLAGEKKFKKFGRIEIVSQRAVPQGRGVYRVDTYSYEYRGNGTPIAGAKQVRSARRLEGKVEQQGLEYQHFDRNTPLGRGLLARWAPNESGKGLSFLAGIIAAVPAYLMAGITAHPLELFVWTAAGLLLGGLGYQWSNRYPFTKFRTKHAERILLGAGVGLGALTLLSASMYPAAMSWGVGYLAGRILAARVLPSAAAWISGPLKAKLRRRGTGFSKFKLALVGVAFATLLGTSFNPSPVEANDRAALAARMESAGPVGAEYADFMRTHTDVPIYFAMPWHREDMSSAIGKHYDANALLSPARIYLSGEAYGVRSAGDWASFELALSTLLHEFDHDRTEELNGGAPTTLEHEHSAWDHQARFILEQFKKNSDLFKPGHNNNRKYLMLKRAQRWLSDGPAEYRSYVDSNYGKNKPLSKIKTAKKEQLEKFYAAHRAEMEEAWKEAKKDPALRSDLSKTINALIADGAATSGGETLVPTDASLLGRFFAAFASLLAVFGLGALVGPRARRPQEGR